MNVSHHIAISIANNRSRQLGAATLVLTLVVLIVLTVIVLSSTHVALFEQRTAANENRQQLADQAAEYAMSLGGEFLKANMTDIASAETSGWLNAGSVRWLSCAGITSPATHPCLSEPNATRRAELYFYSYADSATSDDTLIPHDSLIPAASAPSSVGGSANFAATVEVRALLCRLDTTISPSPECRASPDASSNNRIAITLIGRSQLTGENAAAEVKETWANFDTFGTSSAAPLIASGAIDGTGNVEIVTSPNGGGASIPVSIWTPADADVDKTGSGSAASISTCQLGEFLQDTPEADLKTTCPTVNTACGCPAANSATSPEAVYASNPNFLSGHIPSSSPACCENLDILDRDGDNGVSPDIQFFPGAGIDDVSDLTDDSLFEWIFTVSDESESTQSPINGTGNTLTNCGSGSGNCAVYNLTQADRLNAESVTCAQLDSLGSSASGLYYVTDSATSLCTLPSQVGTPDSPAIVVLEDEARLNSTLFYGLLFIRSDDNSATFRGVGNSEVYGSVVVQGTADISGSLRLVYDDTSVSGPGKKLPDTTRLARVPGSWLDGSRGF